MTLLIFVKIKVLQHIRRLW